MNKIIIIPAIALIFFFIDLYAFEAVKTAFQHTGMLTRKIVFFTYWGVTAISILLFFVYHFANPDAVGRIFRSFILVGLFMNYFSKLFIFLFLVIDDLVRLGRWGVETITSLFRKESISQSDPITRSEFLSKAALVTASIPVIGMTYGILVGAHDYRIRRKTIYLPNLPASFDGIKIGQISDIHSGSFFNKTAVRGGVEMFLKEKPDIIFFTGDLVNNQANEVVDYFDIFKKIDAPLGVYSTLGNHDYGDYVSWPSKEAKVRNLETLKTAHQALGWNLLMNENKIIEQRSDKLAIIGVENWSATARFPKYGKLSEASRGTEEAPVKLLLSHDPSHWDGEVRAKFPDIDIMFAGHTHGFQFGVEIAGIKWSPVKYFYKQWAGLYQEANQYLYVNRGFGYLGYPGRIGIPPEITIIELKRKVA